MKAPSIDIGRIILVGVGLLFLGTQLAAQEQREEPRRLTVNASAELERAPERAMLLLAVESQAESAQDASRQNAQSMEQVIAALRRAGIEGEAVRTHSYQLNPVYIPPERGESGPRISGYRAINMVEVRVDSLDDLGPLIDAAIAAGANRVANLHFELRDPESARLEAIEQAVEKAAREAEVVARASGQRLGPPLDIQTTAHFPMLRADYAERAVAMDAAQVATPIEEGTITIVASVTIVYRLDMP